jgi:Concanavalin A-like lectin/glucanases superfamily
MKLNLVTSAVLCSTLIFFSCKKDTTTPPIPNTDTELLAAQPDKVAHYNFNGNLRDSSGNNLNPVYVSNITYTPDRFGRSGQAAMFNGPSNISFIAIPSPAAKISGFPFSISMWFKTTDVSRSQTLVKADGGEYNIYSGYWLQIGAAGSGTLSFNIGNNNGENNSTGRNTITTPAILTANTWYHVVVNARGANDMDFYINGTKNNNCIYDGSANTMVFGTQGNQQNGALGFYLYGNSVFEGAMDDYRIYKKVLSPSEILTLYNFHP